MSCKTKRIDIKFVDFWSDFQEKNNFIFHALAQYFDVQISDTPDYIVYSTFGYEHLRYKDSVRIFFSGENQTPDFNICDYAIGFHFITFEDRYLRLPLYYLYDKDLKKASSKHLFSKEDFLKKKNFCNFIYSNSNADPKRELFFNLLNLYKKVDSGGGYLNNIGYRIESKFDFQLESKFTIAFENSSTPGYTTEKILQAFSAKTIPIYWGNPNISREFNTDSFINCHDFDSFEDVIQRIKEIDEDDELYLKILNSPIALEVKDLEDYYTVKIEDFIMPIFSVNKENAFRRNRVYWGEKYENNMINKFVLPSVNNSIWSVIKRKYSLLRKINE